MNDNIKTIMLCNLLGQKPGTGFAYSVYDAEGLAPTITTLTGGGQTTDDSCRVVVVGYVYRSQQNGQVYDPRGLSPTICVGHHAGVEPRIIEYEDE